MTKLDKLKENLRGLGSVAVAFSGGVDSTFLLKVAQEVLEDKVLALTAASKFVPRREINETIKFCAENKIRQIIFEADVLNIEGVKENPENRCYVAADVDGKAGISAADARLILRAAVGLEVLSA